MSNGKFRQSHSASFFGYSSRTEDQNPKSKKDYGKENINHLYFSVKPQHKQ